MGKKEEEKKKKILNEKLHTTVHSQCCFIYGIIMISISYHSPVINIARIIIFSVNMSHEMRIE